VLQQGAFSKACALYAIDNSLLSKPIKALAADLGKLWLNCLNLYLCLIPSQ